MQRVLIIGATSAIAEATARLYAQRNASLYLVGRNEEKLNIIRADLQIRGAAHCDIHVMDIAEIASHEDMIQSANLSMGGIDIALIAHGTLPCQATCDKSTTLALQEFHINGTATIALSNEISNFLQTGGTLAVISSVAGDRGRASNYLYGSAKAAVSTYLSGLGQRLRSQGINVLTIKPGFVDTPMTAAFKKGLLWASPESVARGIISAIDRRRSVAYLPWFWWGIMQIIKNIPEPIFRRIKL